jgi:acyl transferase domain-containing protein
MEPLWPALAEALHEVRPRPAAVPFYSTVTGGPFPGDALTADYWGRNLREPVRFADAVNGLIADGFDVFLEISPHPVLAEPLGQCLRHAKREGRAFASLRRGADDRTALLGTLAELYARGIPVAWDRVQRRGRVLPLPAYPWRRDRCWFEAERPPVGANGFHRNGHVPSPNGHVHQSLPTDGWLVRPAWARLEAPEAPARLAGSWLVVADDPVTRNRLPALLRERGADCVVVSSGEQYATDGPDRFRIDPSDPDHWRRLLRDAFPAERPALEGVIHLASLAAPPADGLSLPGLSHAQERGCVSALHLVQALAATGVTFPRLWLVTRGAQPVEGDEAAAVAQVPLWGLGRALAHEIPDIRSTLIDLPATPGPGDYPALLRSLGVDGHEGQLAWRGDALFAARLRPDAGAAGREPPALRPDATYLITGGLGGLGLAVARWLVGRGARSLVLTGRRGPGAEAEAILAELRQAGTIVMVARADVADPDQLAAVLAEIDLDLPPLRGVVHAAGVLDDGIALQLDRRRLWAVLAPKVLGAWNLHVLTAGRTLDFFVLFSSAASLLGSPGQANYAAANATLDALAHFRRARNLPAVSINWGPWAELGMAARGGREARLAQAGLGSIPVDLGLDVLGRLLAAPVPQVAVLPVEWSKWRQFLPGDRPPAVVAELIGLAADGPGTPPTALNALDRAAVLAAPPDDRPAVLEGQLRELVARVLRLPAPALDVEQPLNTLGVDSLMAIELKNRIEGDLGVSVPMVKFLEGPSVRDLADDLARRLLPAAAAATRVGPGTVNPGPGVGLNADAAGDLLEQLDALTDDQVDALLNDLYAPNQGD